MSNTNWQGYGGESTMSYLTQMAGLAVQNFLSAATGIAVAFAMIRGFTLKRSASIGNFFVDVYRITVYMLLPLSAICALLLVSQGMVQNFSAYVAVAPLDSAAQPTPGARHGPRSVPGCHKDAGDQRRWFLQRQRFAPI